MEDKDFKIFKGKYAVLVLLLNIIIFTIAFALLLILLPIGIENLRVWEPRIYITAACIVIAVICLIIFIPKYKSTKAWLEVHGETKEERLTRIRKEKDEERARIRAELEAEIRSEMENENKDKGEQR